MPGILSSSQEQADVEGAEGPSVGQCLPTPHSAFCLVISKNSTGALDTDKNREQWRLPVGEELGISVISTWREVQMVECGARTAFYHCLKDVASCGTVRRVNLR